MAVSNKPNEWGLSGQNYSSYTEATGTRGAIPKRAQEEPVLYERKKGEVMTKELTEQNVSRRAFVGATAAAAALAATSGVGSAFAAEEAKDEAAPAAGEDRPWHGVADMVTKEITVQVPGLDFEKDGMFHPTFNGGPLTAAEQHATLTSYDWRKNQLTASQIVEDAKAISDEEALEIIMNEPEITTDWTTPEGKVIPAVYVALRNRLLATGQGVGAEINETAWDFLMQEFTPEEAEFYIKVPNYTYFTGADVAEAVGMSAEDAEAMASDLSYRGLLNRLNKNGQVVYHCLAFAHGMLEFMMNRYEEDGFVNSVFSMLGADYGYQSRNQGHPMYFPIPAEQDIVGDPEILPNHDWNEIIDRYDTLCVAPCQCRTFTPIRAGEEPPMDCHPVETCIATGEQAQYYIENGIGRQIDKDECREIIQRSVDAGMVIEVMSTAECDVICSCHGDCCSILKGFIALDGDIENFHWMSHYELQVDHTTCIKCGSCAARCPLFTITMDGPDGTPQIGNLCVRCGQCATVCPTGSRKLFARPEEDRFYMPENMVDDYKYKAIQHAKRGYINYFDPAKYVAPEPEAAEEEPAKDEAPAEEATEEKK